ncbi:MAG TPA: proline dehydrogenase family protein [Gaiellaceae bacterium]|nr:proline dehydrogenase family protein [Gaiellaceae bacterium]
MTRLDSTISRLLPAIPRPVVRRLAAPYIAGPTLDDAVRVVRRLNSEGKLATVDVLGEEVSSSAEAERITVAYFRVLERVENERLDANISVKLTGLGLELGEDVCRANLRALVDDAKARGNFVRIDMEDSSTTDATLGLYSELRADGHENLGVVLQAYMRRTATDLDGLENVRLCKGIYVEPLEVAFQDPDEVRGSYLGALDALLDQGAYVGIATHDELLISEALRRIGARGLGRDRYEFQMLLGVRAARGDELVAAGHQLRVYVPFGTHWYEYSIRRLQENPKLAGYAAGDTVRRLASWRP